MKTKDFAIDFPDNFFHIKTSAYEDYSIEQTLAANGCIDAKVPAHGAAAMILLCKDFERIRSLKNLTKFSETKL